MLLILCPAQMTIMPGFSMLPVLIVVLFAKSYIWAAFGWSFNAAQQVRLIALNPDSASVLPALNGAAMSARRWARPLAAQFCSGSG